MLLRLPNAVKLAVYSCGPSRRARFGDSHARLRYDVLTRREPADAIAFGSMRVRAITHGSVQGRGFRPGDEFEIEEHLEAGVEVTGTAQAPSGYVDGGD